MSKLIRFVQYFKLKSNHRISLIQIKDFILNCEKSLIKTYPNEEIKQRNILFDQLENIIYTILYDKIYPIIEESEIDYELDQKFIFYDFISFTTLGINKNIVLKNNFQFIKFQIGKIYTTKNAKDKIHIIFNICKMIEEIMKNFKNYDDKNNLKFICIKCKRKRNEILKINNNQCEICLNIKKEVYKKNDNINIKDNNDKIMKDNKSSLINNQENLNLKEEFKFTKQKREIIPENEKETFIKLNNNIEKSKDSNEKFNYHQKQKIKNEVNKNVKINSEKFEFDENETIDEFEINKKIKNFEKLNIDKKILQNQEKLVNILPLLVYLILQKKPKKAYSDINFIKVFREEKKINFIENNYLKIYQKALEFFLDLKKIDKINYNYIQKCLERKKKQFSLQFRILKTNKIKNKNLIDFNDCKKYLYSNVKTNLRFEDISYSSLFLSESKNLIEEYKKVLYNYKKLSQKISKKITEIN